MFPVYNLLTVIKGTDSPLFSYFEFTGLICKLFGLSILNFYYKALFKRKILELYCMVSSIMETG
ncbi:hypothetical protein LIBAT_11600 [Leptospira interrogans]